MQKISSTNGQSGLEIRRETESNIPIEFQNRIAECIGTFRSNCVGTALYITGEIKADEYINAYRIAYMLFRQENKEKSLQRVDEPVPGCIIIWRLDLTSGMPYAVQHAGVITSIKPMLMAHRCGPLEEFVVDQQVGESFTFMRNGIPTIRVFNKDAIKEYYLPHALTKSNPVFPR